MRETDISPKMLLQKQTPRLTLQTTIHSDLGRHSISCHSLLRLTPAACRDQLWPLACFSGEMKPGQLTHQLKQVVSKPGQVNKMYHWFVNLKVNCCYKTALIGVHPIKILCKAICCADHALVPSYI